MSEITAKSVTLSVIYFVVVIVILFFLNLALGWFFDNVVFNILDWFNRLSLVWKIVLLILGGITILQVLLGLFAMIAKFLSSLIFSFAPVNNFTVISSLILATVNTIYNVIVLWKIAPNYSFWVVIELIFLSFFIWSLNTVVVAKTETE